MSKLREINRFGISAASSFLMDDEFVELIELIELVLLFSVL